MKFRRLLLLGAMIPLVACSTSDDNFKLGIAVDGVPIGEYAKKIFTYFNVSKEDMLKADVFTQYDDVKGVANAVKAGTVTVGIVYQTDAFSNRLNKVDTATEEMCGKAYYPISLVKNSAGRDVAAQFFVDYLTQLNAKTIFENVGFTMLVEPQSLGDAPGGDQVVKVAAAASMKETIDALKTTFTQTYTNFTIETDYRGSSKLLKSIKESPNDFDIFLSADTPNMDGLEHAGLVKEGTRFNILENKVALVTPDDNPSQIESFSQLFDVIKKRIEK